MVVRWLRKLRSVHRQSLRKVLLEELLVQPSQAYVFVTKRTIRRQRGSVNLSQDVQGRSTANRYGEGAKQRQK